MKIDQKRLERQNAILDKWEEYKHRASFTAATGFGKTFVGTLAIQRMLDSPNNDGNRSVIIAVPTNYLRNQWSERTKKLAKKCRIRIDTVHNLINEQNHCTLLILDELHTYTSTEFRKVFECVKYNFVLGMTATLREDDEDNRILYDRCPIVDNVSLQECLKHGWVSDFTIYNLGLTLTTYDRNEYNKIDRQFKKYQSFFEHDFDLAKNVLSNDNTLRNFADRINQDEKTVKICAVNFFRKMRERKEFIYNCDVKIDTACQLIKRFNEKIITFSQNTKTADQITEQLPNICVSYHSNVESQIINGKKYGKTRLNRMNVQKFIDNRYKVRVLNTVKSLDEGFDLSDVNTSIQLAYYSSQLNQIQRTGRIIRANGQSSKEINLYIRDSQEERWLTKKQQQSPNIKWVGSIDEIT